MSQEAEPDNSGEDVRREWDVNLLSISSIRAARRVADGPSSMARQQWLVSNGSSAMPRYSMRRRDVIVFGAAAAAYAVAPRETRAAAPRWIDVHLHVVGGVQRQFGQAVDQAVAEMDAQGIAKAIVFPPPATRLMFDYLACIAELRRYPGRFGFLGGGGMLNSMIEQFSSPDSVTPDVRQRFVALAEQMADAGAAGYGEIAVLYFSPTLNHPFEQVSPEHPLLARSIGEANAVRLYRV
jgi:hypothetical protein